MCKRTHSCSNVMLITLMIVGVCDAYTFADSISQSVHITRFACRIEFV